MNILDDIVATKRAEVEDAKKRAPLETLVPRPRTSGRFVFLFETGPVLIAEIKPKSPSEGALIERSPLDIADLYAKSGADVISVLTDSTYFGGSLALLEDVRAHVPQLLLRKDFIIDPYQVHETAASSADVFLLIASILQTDELRSLRELGESFGLDALIEVHDEADIEKALASGARVIGINNRDLTKMETDLATTERLAHMIPRSIPLVSESGIHQSGDVERVRKAGARGILVGTSILRSENPLEHISELKKSL
ncbi:indole-3-glycerol phosphate synthase TrpC [Candidatus Kaiserbacteria bacterium]|nr:indole-3-glycerol phosphate synthase TrpC [Candidatus Kaiserbacteria bacterium]